MLRKIGINFLLFCITLLLIAGLVVLLYYFYFSDASTVFNVVFTFFMCIVYSNIFSKLFLFFWKENFAHKS